MKYWTPHIYTIIYIENNQLWDSVMECFMALGTKSISVGKTGWHHVMDKLPGP